MNRTTVIHLARRAAMTLLATLLLTMTAQTAWAGDYESENRTVTIIALTNGSISIVRNDTHETVSSGTQLPAGTSIPIPLPSRTARSTASMPSSPRTS